jgi:hypothetical protein
VIRKVRLFQAPLKFYGKGCHLAGLPRLLEDASVDHGIHRFPDQKANQKPQRSSHSRPPQCAKSVGRCDGSGGLKRQTVTDPHRSKSLTELRLFKFLQHCLQQSPKTISFGGWILDGSTVFRIPTSPLGYLFSPPRVHVQTGGQFRVPR